MKHSAYKLGEILEIYTDTDSRTIVEVRQDHFIWLEEWLGEGWREQGSVPIQHDYFETRLKVREVISHGIRQ